ncbi:MAG TPA: hypothetical protein VD993_16755 [Chitinophagaceae bacterium]|nr:hypothetical protein [Chitinophagaceae bacterium]
MSDNKPNQKQKCKKIKVENRVVTEFETLLPTEVTFFPEKNKIAKDIVSRTKFPEGWL